MIFQIIVLFSILRYKTAHKQLENIYTVVYVWSDHNFHVFERLTGNGLILQHFHIMVQYFLHCDTKKRDHVIWDAWISHRICLSSDLLTL